MKRAGGSTLLNQPRQINCMANIVGKKDMRFIWQPKKGRVLILKYEKGRG